MLDNFLMPYPKTIDKLLEGKYKIPIMQRDYVWKERNVKDLLEDVQNSIEDLEEEDQYYFIGSMVSSLKSLDGDKTDREFIIDGQQRLITLTLIISAARDIFRFRKFFSNNLGDIDETVIQMYDQYIFFNQKSRIYDELQKRPVIRVTLESRVELQNREDNDFLLKNIDNNSIFNSIKELTIQKLKGIEVDISEEIKELFKNEELKPHIEKLISSLKKICSYVDYEEEVTTDDFTNEIPQFLNHINAFKDTIKYEAYSYDGIILNNQNFKKIINCALVDILIQIHSRLVEFSFKDNFLSTLLRPLKLNKKELREYLTQQITQKLLIGDSKINETIKEKKIDSEREYHIEYKKLQNIRQGNLQYSELPYFEKVLLQSIDELESELFLIKQNTLSATQRNIHEAKSYTYNFMKDMETLDIVRFIDQLLSKVAVVKLTTNDFSSAYRIFETINERGLGLSPEDLLKNLILKGIIDIDSRNTISNIWDEFKNTFLNKAEGKYIVGIPTFLKHYIMSKEEYISKNSIFKFFKDKYGDKDQNEIEILVNELLDHAKAYISIIQDDKSLFNKLNFKQAYIVQLAMHNLSKNTKEKINKYLQNLAFVFFITNARTNELERKFVEIAKIIRQMEIDGEKESLLRDVVNKIESLYLEKKESFNEGIHKFKYNEKMPKHVAIVRYFFGTISLAIDGNDFQNYTIEHIMNAKRGQSNLSADYQKVSQKLGNLTLLLGNDNSALNNVEHFHDKLSVYKKSSCTLTRSLVEPVPFPNNTKQKLVWEKYNFRVQKTFEAEQVEERTKYLLNVWNYLFFNGYTWI
ncbi:TPA: DUF262 domain-containing protein [Bacillus cereus]|nr:DUF262 domain-containing protein [Bacillus cereus]